MNKPLHIFGVADKAVTKKNLILKIAASNLSPEEKCRQITKVRLGSYNQLDDMKIEAATESDAKKKQKIAEISASSMSTLDKCKAVTKVRYER